MIMVIYDNEKNDGLEPLINGNNKGSIASTIVTKGNSQNYDNLVKAVDAESLFTTVKNYMGDSPLDESMDIQCNYGVMVSSNWNRNDDVFSPSEMWKARYSPRLKPVNMGHLISEVDDKNTTIGVIVNSLCVDDEYNILSYANEGELPENYHLCIKTAIWKWYWPKTVSMLNDDIAEDKKFLSMECLFKNFGYAIKSMDSDVISLMPRNDLTSMLTKYLRAYGGSGEVTIGGKNYVIGRWLQDIIFTGVAYVAVPANPDSIIFGSAMGSFQTLDLNEALSMVKKVSNKNGVLLNRGKITLWP